MASKRATLYRDVPTSAVAAGGAVFAYRSYGPDDELPLVMLTHLGANLDGWDPLVIDGLARDRRVIAVDYRGVGDSTGAIRSSIDDMAADMIAVVRALGFTRVDLFGLSMGGMVAQALVTQAPDLVDRLILAGAGPAGGPGLTRMTGVMVRSVLRAALTFTDPKTLLFFTRTRTGRKAAHDYLDRLAERTTDRDARVTPGAYRAQLTAVKEWGAAPSATFSAPGPALIVHGDSDRMVPPANAHTLARLVPGATVTVFPDSGHGVVFQNHDAFVAATRDFLYR
ncbi:alpha/beta fold hydrolase [Cryobacterium arcticum]|uniref:Alpha/beta hydrolase n=1 Tax=Cryobacterium arcticum TaxID=670052 RepID=A0A1B1BPJ3_9MICO|nr:alpha/beta hydrolase [Cryobacterium arcticum]ANP74303.1 alpha/beta hydrolase [Cryobacterium arcticum]